MKVRVRFIVAAFLMLVVLQCLGVGIPGLDLLFFLAIGWVLYLIRVGSQVQVRWDLAGSAVVYAGGFFSYYSYNFCWCVRSLRQRVRKCRYRPRTPAMAAGLTDHVWSVQEWLAYPVVGLSP